MGCQLMRRYGRADHAARAAEMRLHPRMWVLVAVYNGAVSADSTGRQIANGRLNQNYQPAGAFETRMVPDGMGTALYARFIGAGT